MLTRFTVVKHHLREDQRFEELIFYPWTDENSEPNHGSAHVHEEEQKATTEVADGSGSARKQGNGIKDLFRHMKPTFHKNSKP